MPFAGAAATSTGIANTGRQQGNSDDDSVQRLPHEIDGHLITFEFPFRFEASLSNAIGSVPFAGAAASSTAIANTGGSLAILMAALFGGFLMSRAQMPIFAQWLSSLSFVRCGPKSETRYHTPHERPQMPIFAQWLSTLSLVRCGLLLNPKTIARWLALRSGCSACLSSGVA